MVTVERIRDDSEKRILRCSEGNRVWYQMWINPGDMMRIELLLEGGSRTWMIELQKYYVFFYERKNGRRILGKDREEDIGYPFIERKARDIRSLASLCEVYGVIL